jgi:hypothetical protein
VAGTAAGAGAGAGDGEVGVAIPVVVEGRGVPHIVHTVAIPSEFANVPLVAWCDGIHDGDCKEGGQLYERERETEAPESRQAFDCINASLQLQACNPIVILDSPSLSFPPLFLVLLCPFSLDLCSFFFFVHLAYVSSSSVPI